MSIFDGRIIIEINRYDSPGRKNFTVCHEVGHIELRKAANLLQPSRSRRGRFLDKEKENEGTTKEEERLVEEFAAGLLMPRKVFLEKARSVSPGITSAKDIARLFGTSLAATLRRIVSLRAWPCVMIWGIPEKMKGENAWAVRIQEFKSTLGNALRRPTQDYVWWAGEQFWRSSQCDLIVADIVAIEDMLWTFEGLREWHYTPSGERENRVMSILLPAQTN